MNRAEIAYRKQAAVDMLASLNGDPTVADDPKDVSFRGELESIFADFGGSDLILVPAKQMVEALPFTDDVLQSALLAKQAIMETQRFVSELLSSRAQLIKAGGVNAEIDEDQQVRDLKLRSGSWRVTPHQGPAVDDEYIRRMAKSEAWEATESRSRHPRHAEALFVDMQDALAQVPAVELHKNTLRLLVLSVLEKCIPMIDRLQKSEGLLSVFPSAAQAAAARAEEIHHMIDRMPPRPTDAQKDF